MENNIYENDPVFESYLKEQQEKREIKRTANFVGGAFLALMILPFIISTMFVNFLKVVGLPVSQVELIIKDPTFTMFLQIFLSVTMFLLPLGIILYGEHVKLKDIVSFRKPKKELFLPTILVCVGITAFANVVSNMITSMFNGIGLPVSAPDFDVPKGVLGFIISFLAIAVTPAFVEEFALRGVYMGTLKKYGKAFAVVVSAILFGLMHGNLAQIPFAFILGIAIGIAVIKTDSLWTGIIIHFINNAVSVILTQITENLQSTTAQTFVTALYFALCILAFFTGIYLFKGKTRELVQFEDKEEKGDVTKKLKWFFSAPTVIISIVVTGIECLAALFMY